MDVSGSLELEGVPTGSHAGDGHSLSLSLARLEEVRDGFPADPERIAELRFDDGGLAVSVDAAAERGYLAYAFDFGHARIAADGTSALVAPRDGEPAWIWQRYLTGQVLPLAALLQGREVFHACVLEMDGRAIAVFARSGGGKTTTALHLATQGLGFMSDDVLVAEPSPNGLMAHPGLGLANVRPGADELLAKLTRSGLATALGSRPRETRIAIRRLDETLPLAALFVLNRFGDTRALTIEHLSPVNPRVILGATFNFSVRTPERLIRQLDVCACLERSASVFRVVCGSHASPGDVAEAILEHAHTALP